MYERSHVSVILISTRSHVANKIETMYERSHVSVKVEPRPTERLILTLYILPLFYLRD